MSSLARLALSPASRSLIASSTRQSVIISSRSCGWVQDWKPGPYPKTKEEREAAARKYNLIPEDYQPHKEGSGFGDYPKLPAVGEDVRDENDIFDFHYRRRNWAETLHVDYDIHTSDRMNPNIKHRFPYWIMFSSFFGLCAVFIVLGVLDWKLDLHTGNPIKPKQYSWDGNKNYTFEPLD